MDYIRKEESEKREKVNNATPDYAELIIEMVGSIKSERLLKLIYGFVKSAYNEEKAGE